MIFLIDFDGTCITHEFPLIGKDIGAVPVLKELVNAEHKLILWTMRCDHTEAPVTDDPEMHPIGGDYLSQAVNWFKKYDLPLFGINQNPEQSSWTSSPKAYGHYVIDDTAIGCPLIRFTNDRPFVDWLNVYGELIKFNGKNEPILKFNQDVVFQIEHNRKWIYETLSDR